MFVGFTGGFHHEHAVTRVESGAVRMTMPSFYSFDPRHADRLDPSRRGGFAPTR